GARWFRGRSVDRPKLRLVDGERCIAEAREDHLLEIRHCACAGNHLAYGDCNGVFERIAINAATDCGKRNRCESAVASECERAPVTRCEKLRLAMPAALPYRSDGVNDVACGEAIALRHPRFAGTAAAKRAALGEKTGSCGAMNGAIDAAAAEKRRIGGV